MNSVYIKYFAGRLKRLLSHHGKTTLLQFLESQNDNDKMEENDKEKVVLSSQSGPKILTTKEVNDSSLLDSPLSDNYSNQEKIFSNEEEIIIEQNIRKLVLNTSRKIFKDWFKEKTDTTHKKTVIDKVKPSKRKRARRLKRIEDL